MPLNEQDNSRSGWQNAASFARTANAVRRIVKAAAATGLKGAAAAAAQEAVPKLVKLAACLLTALIVLPVLLIAAVPNIFFGYDSSDTEGIARMTRQAMSIGGVCMSLKEFESTVIDSIVTSIAAEYEERGVTIDRIEIISSFDTESLQWFTAINAVAHLQDLEEMSVDQIRELCAARLSYSFSGVFPNHRTNPEPEHFCFYNNSCSIQKKMSYFRLVCNYLREFPIR